LAEHFFAAGGAKLLSQRSDRPLIAVLAALARTLRALALLSLSALLLTLVLLFGLQGEQDHAPAGRHCAAGGSCESKKGKSPAFVP
jgi:hypothetical protein